MVTYLLDTNVISEWRKDPMDRHVRRWVGSVYESELALGVITIAELRSGMARLPVGKRRSDLEQWLQRDVRDRFGERLLPLDVETAEICGTLLGRFHLEVGIRRITDVWLAALALQHDLTIVTRNVKDFQELGVDLLNPWLEDAS